MADTNFPDEWLAHSLEGVVTPELVAELREKATPQATLWETPLTDFVTQNALKFILGQRDFGQWDAYVNELKGKNMTQYIDVVNKAQQRFAKTK